MAIELSWDPKRAALLSMDYQTGIVSIFVKGREELPARAAAVLRRARSLGARVIHVQVGFRPGFPEISSRNALFGAIKDSQTHRKLFEGEAGAIHPAVAPEKDEVIITKHRVSAFAGTDLDMILRANDVDTLILFGIATSGVVLSTVLHAADADYRLVLIKDCCADLDPEVHACLVDKVFPRQAAVVTAAEFLSEGSGG